MDKIHSSRIDKETTVNIRTTMRIYSRRGEFSSWSVSASLVSSVIPSFEFCCLQESLSSIFILSWVSCISLPKNNSFHNTMKGTHMLYSLISISNLLSNTRIHSVSCIVCFFVMLSLSSSYFLPWVLVAILSLKVAEESCREKNTNLFLCTTCKINGKNICDINRHTFMTTNQRELKSCEKGVFGIRLLLQHHEGDLLFLTLSAFSRQEECTDI